MLTNHETYLHWTSYMYTVAPMCDVAVRRGSYVYPRRLRQTLNEVLNEFGWQLRRCNF